MVRCGAPKNLYRIGQQGKFGRESGSSNSRNPHRPGSACLPAPHVARRPHGRAQYPLAPRARHHNQSPRHTARNTDLPKFTARKKYVCHMRPLAVIATPLSKRLPAKGQAAKAEPRADVKIAPLCALIGNYAIILASVRPFSASACYHQRAASEFTPLVTTTSSPCPCGRRNMCSAGYLERAQTTCTGLRR